MKLDQIGFYTLSENRAAYCSALSPLVRCELLLTSRCNFRCPYCRKRTEPDIELDVAKYILEDWASEGLSNVRFSGGEPTLYDGLLDLVVIAKSLSIERIAISTNGSAPLHLYNDLVGAGVNDFSVSLDACCASTGDIMSGVAGRWSQVIEAIRFLASRTYTTVGTVLTDRNQAEAIQIMRLADSLGVSDIRVIPAAQISKQLPDLHVLQSILDKHPILKYRIENMKAGRPVRGISEADNNRCPLVLDDMAVDEFGFHYPCVIYMREHGNPIGILCGDMRKTRTERAEWCTNHNTHDDPICRENCLDVCVDYNNRVRQLRNT